jgi:hypothetical protein
MGRKIRESVQHLALILCTLGVNGCFQSVLLTPSAIESNNEADIVVTTKQGHYINFNGHEYDLTTDEDGRQVVQGKGREYRNGGSQSEVFEGSISVDDIERISTSRKTTMFYVTVGVAAAAIGCFLVLTLALHGRGLGG